MNLLAGEQILLEAVEGRLILTTHRVRFSVLKSGRGEGTSIMLEELSSCSITRIKYRAWLILGIIFLLSPLVATPDQSAAAGLVLGVIFIVVYIAYQPKAIELASASAAIRVKMEKMRMETAESIIDRVEAAKNTRYLLRKGSDVESSLIQTGSYTPRASDIY